MGDKTIKQIMRDNEKAHKEQKVKIAEAKEKLYQERIEFQKSWNKAMIARKNAMKEATRGMIFSKKNRPPKEFFTRLDSGEILVETAGFLPLSEMVRRAERAGINYEEYMAKNYDLSPVDIDNNGFLDSSTMLYPDKIDAFNIMKEMHSKVRADIIKEINDAKQQKDEKDVVESPQETLEAIKKDVKEEKTVDKQVTVDSGKNGKEVKLD